MKFPADIYLRSSYFFFHTNKKASLKVKKAKTSRKCSRLLLAWTYINDFHASCHWKLFVVSVRLVHDWRKSLRYSLSQNFNNRSICLPFRFVAKDESEVPWDWRQQSKKNKIRFDMKETRHQMEFRNRKQLMCYNTMVENQIKCLLWILAHKM